MQLILMVMMYIGIHISKKSFVAAYIGKNGYITKTFKYDKKGAPSFITLFPEDSIAVPVFLFIYII